MFKTIRAKRCEVVHWAHKRNISSFKQEMYPDPRSAPGALCCVVSGNIDEYLMSDAGVGDLISYNGPKLTFS